MKTISVRVRESAHKYLSSRAAEAGRGVSIPDVIDILIEQEKQRRVDFSLTAPRAVWVEKIARLYSWNTDDLTKVANDAIDLALASLAAQHDENLRDLRDDDAELEAEMAQYE